MNVRHGWLMGALLLALPLSACSGAFQQPEVRLDGIRVGSIGLRGGLLYAEVNVTNPNRFDLETSALSYDLELVDPTDGNRWITLAHGVLDEPIFVQRRGETRVMVPIQFRFEDMGGAVRSIIDSGTLNYRVSGDVRLRSPVGRTIPYRKTGVVSMTGARD